MSSIYPNSIDGYAQLPLVVDTVTKIDSDIINRLRSAIVNIEAELGVLPSGDSQTVVLRLNSLDSELDTITSDLAALTLRVDDLETMGSSYKEPCRVATTGDVAVTTASPNIVDGITLIDGNRILVWNQAIQSENGIYRVTSAGTGSDGEWVRDSDFDESSDVIQAGAFTYIQEGDINGEISFTLVTAGTIIIGTTNIEFKGGAFIMRSDLSGTDVIGSSGTPTTLSVANTYVAQPGTTDTRDYDSAVWYATIANKGTATSITVKIDWLEDGSNLGPQGTEDITDGFSVLSVYEASYDITALSAPFNLPVIPLDVIGPEAKVSIKADTGTTTTAYIRVWRKA